MLSESISSALSDKFSLTSKKLVSIFSVPAINLSAYAYSEIPSYDALEDIFKKILLVATFIYTLIKIYFLIVNEIKSHSPDKKKLSGKNNL